MENLDIPEDSQASNNNLPLLHSHLARSLPSTQSMASTLSPGVSTPGSWVGNPWSRGTPDTSPPSTRSGSPDLRAKAAAREADGEAAEAPRAAKTVGNICFIGAGFVGMDRIPWPQLGDLDVDMIADPP